MYRDAASWPSDKATAIYAAHMSTSDRTQCFVWTANHERGPERLLRVLGRAGIETTDLGEVWARARNGESSHDERKRDVSRILCLSSSVPGVVDLWVQVFDALETLHRGVDLNVAAELALQIGAALPRHDDRRGNLASRLQRWIEDQPNSHLLADTRDALMEAGLLPNRPRKAS